MEPKYFLNRPSEGMETNHKSAQEIMTMFELGGVFSDLLLQAVFTYLSETMYWLEKGDKGKALEGKISLYRILTTYTIFSDEFKRAVMLKYSEVLMS